jgi:hypothetical protein
MDSWNEVCFLFWFFGLCCLCRFIWLKRKGRLKPATSAQFFLIASGACCENLSIVLEFAASNSLYHDAWLTMSDASEFKEW